MTSFRPGTQNSLLLALGLTLVIGATAVHGTFTVDEGNYQGTLAGLRAGTFAVPGTEGLPPSKELAAFDPSLHEVAPRSTPVYLKAPPLWAFLAWPVSWFGYGALFWMNAVACSLTLLLAERWMARLGAGGWARGGAVASLGLGAYLLEYAQGAWPHCTSLALVFGAFVCASERRRGGGLGWAAAGGLLAGVAVGLRYPNVAPGAAIGMGLLLAGGAQPIGGPGARLRAVAAYAAGMAVPLAASSWINHVRFGSWNPVSKGPGYLSVPSVSEASGGLAGRVGSMLVAVWSRVVDYRVTPLPPDPMGVHGYLKKDPESGAILIGRILKKSLLQSAPWALLGLVVLVWVWRRPARTALERELRAATLVVGAIVGVFAIAGPLRSDGLCFNQRYLIEALPFLAVSAGSIMPRGDGRGGWLALCAGALAAYVGWSFGGRGKEAASLMSTLPLVLAALLVGARLAMKRWPLPALGWGTWAALGLCIGWGLGIHLGDDMVPSRAVRERSAGLLAIASEHVAADSALFAYWGNKDPYGPMQLTHRTLVIDPWPDRGEAAPALVDALFARQQRVFVVVHGMPPDVLARIVGARELVTLADYFGHPLLAEVR